MLMKSENETTNCEVTEEEFHWRKAVVADLRALQNQHWEFAKNITLALLITLVMLGILAVKVLC